MYLGRVTFRAMKNRTILIFSFCVGLVAAVAFSIWFLAQPRSAADLLKRAQTIEARNSQQIATLKSSGSTEDTVQASKLLADTLANYQAVTQKYPGTAESEDADYRSLQIRDENSTSPETRIALITQYLDQHTSTPHAADLRWQQATLTRKELKKPLEAVKLFQAFAKDFPKDERAPEALFQVGNIYEEIREFPTAVHAYEQLAKDYPHSKFADEAQFRSANLLADKLDKKKEAEQAFAKIEKENPKSPFASAAGGQRKKLAQAAEKTSAEKSRDDYYGGVREVDALERSADQLDSPQMQMIRAQKVDLLHQTINAAISPSEHILSATVEMSVAASQPTTGTFAFQLGAPLKLSSLQRNGSDARFTRQEGFVLVELGDKPLQPGTTETFSLAYSGTNSDTWGGDIITSASTYLLVPKWAPILDLGDMFTADISLTVPPGYYALSQGVLVNQTSDTQGTTFVYTQSSPVFHYAAVTAPYAVREAEFDSKAQPGKKVKIQVCLFAQTPPEYFDGYLKEIPSILDFLESKLGPFPYDKFAVAQVNFFPGGLSSPSLIIIGQPGFEKKGVPAAFLAHEASHAWFGNQLGLNLVGGSIPWLSEGFAQYWDALYHEHSQGRPEFIRHMRTLAGNYYTAVSAADDKPLEDSKFSDSTYQSVTYDKGAFVLHALRGVMGDEKFFDLLRHYTDGNRQQIVNTATFQKAAEKEYGSSLDWFFTEWLGKKGIPRYRINRALQQPGTGGKFKTEVEIEQLDQSFNMPVEIEITTKAAPERRKLQITDTLTTTIVETSAEPIKVTLDPDYWILKFPRTEDWEKPVTAESSSR